MASNVYDKLQDARVILQNTNLKKSGKNKFSGFTYFELADFLPAINQIFKDLKLFSNFSLHNDCAELIIINTENTEEQIVFSTPTEDLELKGCTKIQALGGIHTYLKRYLYLNALEIIEADMLDVNVGSDKLNTEKTSIKQSNKEFINDNDLDIINEMSTIKDLNKLIKFKDEFKSKVSDEETFKRLYMEKYKALNK